MADEQYRRFHSGRFGPQEGITPNFATIVDTTLVSRSPLEKKKKKKEDEDPEEKKMKEDDKFMEEDDTSGESF